ncbi:MAG: VaFE repeat-containing surface-anchored protein, partial [Lachnospiraceae bacterium]|nr:VaFE repeat-containing surface-anchored protein [Lachnospiraceae bacterium]
MKTNILRRVLAITLALIMGLSVASPFDLTAFAAEASEEETPTYTVEIQDSQNGTVRFEDSKETSREYAPGDTVTIMAEPDDGYGLDELTVSSREEVTLNEKSETTFTFKMPESDVIVEAAFSADEEAVSETVEETTEASSEEEAGKEETDEAEETVARTESTEATETVAGAAVTLETAAAAAEESTAAEEESALSEAAQAVQDMIDALPTADELEDMDEDELNEAYNAILEVDEAWQALTEEEQTSVDDSKLDELYEYFNTLTMTTASTGTSTKVSVSRTAKYRYSYYGVGSSWSTNKYEVEYTIDGTDVTAYAYCVEPSEKAPGSGKYTVTKLSSSNTLAKVVYYGTESLSGTKCFWEQEGYSGYSDGYRWIIVHIAPAYAYGRSDWDYCISSSTAKKRAKELVEFAEDAEKLPSGSSIEEPYFSYEDSEGTEHTNEDGSKLTVSALESTAKGDQYTPYITFHADETVYVKFTLQKGMSYIVKTNPSGSGSEDISDSDGTDTVTIYGGTTFRFRAPLDQVEEVSSTYSKTLKPKNLKDYSAYKLQYGSSGYQSLVTVFGDSLEAKTSFKINWISTPSLSITKSVSSASEDYARIVKNNPNYTLEGAKYGVYATEEDAKNGTNRLRLLVTDEDGQTTAVTQVASTYTGDETYYTAGQKFAAGETLYIKEIVAPSGYQLDTTIYEVTLTSGDNELEMEDVPLYATVSLEKLDKAYQEGLISAEDVADMSNIWFRLRFFRVTDVSEMVGNPTKAWNIKTLKASDGSYTATLDDDHMGSLSSLIFEDEEGNYVIPLGGLTIQEFDASTVGDWMYDEEEDGEVNSNYSVNDMSWIVGDETYNGTSIITLMLREQTNADGTKSVVVEDSDGNTLSTGSSLQVTAEDYQVYGNLTIEKVSYYNKQKLGGATFHLEDSDGSTVVPTTENGITGDIDSTGMITVQSDGTATVEHIPAGSYTLVEDNAPVGYHTDFSENIDILGGDSIETVENVPVLAGVKIQKYDTDSEEAAAEGDATLEGAIYDIITLQNIYNDKYGTSYSAGDVVYTLITDEDGSVESPADILTVGSYQIVETSAPTGYLAGDSVTFTISQISDGSLQATLSGSTTPLVSEEKDGGALFDLTGGELSDPVIRGGFSIRKVDEDVDDASLTGTQGDAPDLAATYTVTNGNTQAVLVNGTKYAAGAVCFTFTTASDGTYTSTANLLPYGKYTITETAPPTGYNLAAAVSFTIFIQEDGRIVTADVDGKDLGTYTRDPIIRGGIQIQKVDEESADNELLETMGIIPQGDASLAGAAFDIINMSAHSVLVDTDEDGEFEIYEAGDVIDTLTTDENGFAATSEDFLPYGTYKVVETAAPEGYEISSDTNHTTFTVSIREDRKIYEKSDDGTTIGLYMEDPVIRGGVEIRKRDAQSEDGTAEGAATLEGAVINIYNISDEAVLVDSDGDGTRERYAPGQLVYTLTTDAKGYAGTADNLFPYGTYVAVEVSSPTGYLTMKKSYLEDDEAAALGFTYSRGQDIYYDEASETSYFYDMKERAFYCYTAYVTQSAKRLYVETSEAERFYDAETGLYYDEATDTRYFYDADAGQYYYLSYVRTSTYSYGAYETKFEIREDGKTVDLTGEEESIYDLVKRADLSIYKVDDESQRPMEGVQFRITSMTTGESHIVTTDANGYYNSTQTAHSSVNGLWFGLDEDGNSVPVDDSLGALPYDTYYIEELEGTANEGMTMWSGYIYVTADTVYENGYVINLDINNREAIISTSASNEETGNKYLAASEGAVVEDTITYKNLETGTYLLRSVLMDRDTQKVIVDVQGKEAIGEKTVKISSGSGSTTAEITLDASSLSGVNAVVFEYFYTVDEEGKETLVYSHADFEDEEQYVYFAGIGTTATDSETEDHVACADEEITLIDVVEYTNLPANRTFTLTGTLMLQSTGKEYLDDNGKTVTAETTFTSSSTGNCSVEVKFTLIGANLAGEAVVVFEQLSLG